MEIAVSPITNIIGCMYSKYRTDVEPVWGVEDVQGWLCADLPVWRKS